MHPQRNEVIWTSYLTHNEKKNKDEKITQLSEVIATLEAIEVKGVNDDALSMKIRNEELPCGV